MRPSFHPCLVNDSFSDPCLYIHFIHSNQAVIFDLGDISGLSAGHVLKTGQVFISHTHIDHFIGFDRLLRLVLGRDKTIQLFGPENFLNNIEGKLAAYNWNLIDNYTQSVVLQVTEVRHDRLLTREYACRDRFRGSSPLREEPFCGKLCEEAGFTVSTVILDHGIPCLGFCLEEQFHINIKTNRLAELGLEPGPWLKKFKTALFDHLPRDTRIAVPGLDKTDDFPLGFLTDNICVITPGQKITYITDVARTAANIDKIVEFTKDSDYLFIESHFLEQDRAIAEAKRHLTARLAGEIAGRAGAKRLTTFHYSPRYTDVPELIKQEANDAYQHHFRPTVSDDRPSPAADNSDGPSNGTGSCP